MLHRLPSRQSTGFSLIELLLVASVMVLMATLAVPAFNSIKGGADLGAAATEMKGALDQARSYAMANNTYVYVGIAEVNAALDSSARPQIPANSQVGGRVAVGIVATRDGGRHYAVLDSSQGSDWQANYSNGQHLVQLGKVQRFEGVHLVKLNGPGSSIPSRGGMSRPAIADPEDVIGGGASGNSATPFALPIGSGLGSGYQYRFEWVIQFDPQGIARVVTAGNGDKIGLYLEIGLQQAHGNQIPPAPSDQSTGNLAAIQIDCMTGKVRLYRP